MSISPPQRYPIHTCTHSWMYSWGLNRAARVYNTLGHARARALAIAILFCARGTIPATGDKFKPRRGTVLISLRAVSLSPYNLRLNALIALCARVSDKQSALCSLLVSARSLINIRDVWREKALFDLRHVASVRHCSTTLLLLFQFRLPAASSSSFSIFQGGPKLSTDAGQGRAVGV